MTATASGPDEVHEFLEQQVGDGMMPGASWRIEKDGRLISGGAVGSTALPALEQATQETPYDLASLTKPLATAALALLLEQEGKIDLAVAASEVLDELRGSPYASATTLDLGTHRAGLPAWKPLYLEASGLAAFVRAIAKVPPVAPAGTTLYSDLGYILLGAVIERVSGVRLDRLFEERIRKPLGLLRIGYPGPSSSFEDAAATEQGNAHERALAGSAGASYRFRAGIPRGEVHDGNAHGLGGVAGHAGLFGTAAEVAAIAKPMIDPVSSSWSERSRRRLLEPAAGEGSRSFGFVMARDSSAASEVLPDLSPGHTGFTGTSVWLDPQARRVFVLLANRVHPAVRSGGFQLVRRGFHRIADELSRT